MLTSLQVSTTNPNFQPILDKALEEYKKKTKQDLITHPLAEEIRGCDSPEAILVVLQGKANELNQSQSRDERLTKWLMPTVNVLNALSATLGAGLGTAYPLTQIVFSGIGILLVAARDTAARLEALIELFERMENFFVRLHTYTEVPLAAAMTDALGKLMAEVLSMLAIATKEMKRGRTNTFFKKLIGRNDIEDALQKLDKLEQGELRTVAAQVLKTTSALKEATSNLRDDAKETKVMVEQIASKISSRDWERLLQDLRGWLTPPDPSTNHNIACSAQHERTATWIFNEKIFERWESSGSLLWIHGKAGSGKSVLCSAIIQHIIALRDSGSASVAYFYFDFRDVDKKHRRNLLPSLLIQLSARSESCLNILSRLYSTYKADNGQPSEHALLQCLKDMLMASSRFQLPTYIILDALDECPNTSGIPTPREQVLGLVKDLVDLRLPNLRVCATSRLEIDIWTALEPLASDHLSIHDQPGQMRDIAEYVCAVVQSDTKMTSWREDDRQMVIETISEKADGMFRWVFCQLEVLRHCLAPSLRRQINELPKSLDETYERVLKEIDSTNQGRHARRLLQCLAVAIRPLRVEELAEVLAFDTDSVEGEIPTFRPEWRWEDQEKAVLSACSSLVAIVDGRDGRRVVQFSHFSVKEYLTSNRLATASGNVSRYYVVPEPAHLILAQACLGVLLNLDYRMERTGSDEHGDKGFPLLKYGVQPNLDYLIGRTGSEEHNDKDLPLLEYAATYWASHAQVGSVSSGLKNAMDTLFDINQPYFLAWNQVHNVDSFHNHMSTYSGYKANPLYCAALCGFYDLVHRLIAKFPEQVNDCVGILGYPLVAALSRNHFRVAELLVKHGAYVNVRNVRALRWEPPLCHAIEFLDDTRVNAVRFLLRHGAYVNAGECDPSFYYGGNAKHELPLQAAAAAGCPEVAQILLEHGADVDLPDNKGQIPLHLVSTSNVRNVFGIRKHGHERFILAKLLLERCGDVNKQDVKGETPLHLASYHGQLEVSQLLLDHGATANAENLQGQNTLHVLSHGINDRHWLSDNLQNVLGIAQLLLEHGVNVNALDKDHATPLHLSAFHGRLEVSQVLLDHGANPNAENHLGQTPLHLAAFHGRLEVSKVLLDHGANSNAENLLGQTPLHLASQSKEHYDYDKQSHNVALLLLELGVDVNALDKDHGTPLYLACSHWKFKIAHVLLDYGAEVNVQNADGRTPLHGIGQRFNLADEPDIARVAQRLLEHGADVNARDKNKATPLHLASKVHAANLVEVLLDHGAEADAQSADGQTPLHQVLNRSTSTTSQIVRLLLDRGGADVNAQNKYEKTPLHVACFAGNSESAQILLDHGAELSARNAQGRTPLHEAVEGSRYYPGNHIAWLLLKCGADVDARDKDEATPLHLVSYTDEHPWYFPNPDVGSWMAQALLYYGADGDAQDIDGQTPLHRISRTKTYHSQNYSQTHKTARVLLRHGVDANARDRDQATPLHLASYSGIADIAELLLDNGARANAEDIRGQTPLHQVLLGNHNYQSFVEYSMSQKKDPGKAFHLARRLLESGADVNAQNKDHDTPLHLASRLRLHDMARILIEHGADVNVKNSEGKSPLQLASGRKGKAMKRLLSANTAKQA